MLLTFHYKYFLIAKVMALEESLQQSRKQQGQMKQENEQGLSMLVHTRIIYIILGELCSILIIIKNSDNNDYSMYTCYILSYKMHKW